MSAAGTLGPGAPPGAGRRRVGIAGAGVSGLCAAWLLDGRHDVVLYEADPRLGGHAHTVDVTVQGRTVPVDAGAQMFSERMFPTFHRLLRALDAPLRRSPQTAVLHYLHSGEVFPFGPSLRWPVLCRLLSPRGLRRLLPFMRMLWAGVDLARAGDLGLDVDGFAERMRASPEFRREVLLPLAASMSGASLQDVGGVSALGVLGYLFYTLARTGVGAFRYFEVAGGTRSYVQILTDSLRTVELRAGCGLRRVQIAGGGLRVEDERGETRELDHLVVATPAHAATRLLAGTPRGAQLTTLLDRVGYMPTRIALHGDPARMPPDRRLWSGSNLSFDGQSSEITLRTAADSGVTVLKSWVNYSPMPSSPYHVAEFRHVIPWPSLFTEVQPGLRALQGEHGIWIAGAYTAGIDNHESGVRSALAVVRALDRDNPRVAVLEQRDRA